MVNDSNTEAVSALREQAFLKDLNHEIRWQWFFVFCDQSILVGTIWGVWVVRVLLLAFGAIMLGQLDTPAQLTQLRVAVAVLSTLNIGIPFFASQWRIQQRQEVNDSLARSYAALRTKYLTGVTSLQDAVEVFSDLRTKPVEKRIREWH